MRSFIRTFYDGIMMLILPDFRIGVNKIIYISNFLC